MPHDAVIPVIVSLVAFLGTLVATWLRDRNNPMAQTVTAANATTAQMQAFLAPLYERVSSLEQRVNEQEAHIEILQHQIRSLGHEPHPWPYPPPKAL